MTPSSSSQGFNLNFKSKIVNPPSCLNVFENGKEIKMVYLVICTVALVVSALALFSGFGLGTLLMPAFTIFSKNFAVLKNQVGIGLITAAILVAFLGSFIGSRLIRKITMRTIQIIVGILLFFVSIALGIGLI